VGRDPTLGREEHSNVSLAFFYEKQLIVYKWTLIGWRGCAHRTAAKSAFHFRCSFNILKLSHGGPYYIQRKYSIYADLIYTFVGFRGCRIITIF
jgi:hypothetical protein